LFPLKGSSLHNPLPPNRIARLPGTLEGKPRNWVIDTAGGTESFVVIAAREPLRDLETVLAGIQQPSAGIQDRNNPSVRHGARGISRLGEAEPTAGGGRTAEEPAETIDNLPSRAARDAI